MPRPRPIDVRIAETKEKLEMLQDKKRIDQLNQKIRQRRGKRRRSRL